MNIDRLEERRQRWEQRQEARRLRWEARMARPHYHRSSGILFGAVVVAIGCALLLDNLGVFRIHDLWQYWPVLLIAWGVSHLVDSRTPSGWIWGGVITLLGAFFLLDTLDIIVFNFQLIWPVLLIAFGVSVLIGALERNRFQGGGQSATSPVVGTHAFFSENRGGTDARDFQGGEASAVFGAARFDLRNASMTVDEARIHFNVMFGEAEVRVPENWNVVSRASVTFGAVNDKTSHPGADPNVKTPRLVITGTIIFGALTLRN